MKEQTRNTEVQINEEEIGKLPEKEFRMMIINMIKNLENKMEEMQESINKDLELKNKHTETNNTITEIKNTLEGINSKISEAEKWISVLEDKMVEITSEEQNKIKRMKRTEDSLRDLCDNIKDTNIWIIQFPEEEKNKGYEKIFEEITVENFPNMEKEMISSPRSTKTPIQGKPKKNHAKTHTNETRKTKHKERISIAAREKQQVPHKGKPICLTADLSAETLQARGEQPNYKHWNWSCDQKSPPKQKPRTRRLLRRILSNL